jgi:integrase/recombinase XerD
MDAAQSTPLILRTEFKVITPLAETAEAFLKSKRSEGVSKNTIHYYGADLKNFLAWCDSQFIRTVEDVTAEALRMFLLWLKERGHNGGGTHGHYRTVKNLFRWYWLEYEPTGRNPIEKVKAPRIPDDPQPVITLEEIETLYRTASTARDRSIILTLADSGLRAAELLALNSEDVDTITGEIHVKQGKGNKSRTVFIGKRARRSLRVMLKTHGRTAALFISDEQTRLTYSGLKQILQRLSKKAGIEYRPPHAYRRGFAIGFLRNGGDLLSLQRLLGHSGLSLLGRYARQNTDDLAAKHSECSPMDRGTK